MRLIVIIWPGIDIKMVNTRLTQQYLMNFIQQLLSSLGYAINIEYCFKRDIACWDW